ncbi:MAG: 30S ribosomal protein S27e [Euryarchaeota archaeon]|nr:30S ribosomal protein S27e [Euryarchaeota archaeon]
MRGEKLTGNFVRVSCRDCGNEQIIFERACTKISCNICGATLVQPAGGKAKLVSAAIVESLE